MPRRNGTGPMGTGPMTGRSADHCASFATPEFANYVGGGLGRGLRKRRGVRGGRRGMGFGFRNRFYAPEAEQTPPISADQEKKNLIHEKKALENNLKVIKKRLDELTS